MIILKIFNGSDYEIGQYAAAYRLVEAAILIASPISIIIFRKVRLLHEEHLLQKKYIIKSLLLSALFGLLGLTLIQWIASSLVQLTYGSEYLQAANLLSILGWMIALLIPNAILTQSALALNLEKIYALTATLAATINISLNFFFIPKYGTTAAAYTSVATELIILIGLFIGILQKIKKCKYR